MDNQVLGYKDLAAIPKDKAILDIERPDLMIYEPHFTYSLLEHVELPRSREVRGGRLLLDRTWGKGFPQPHRVGGGIPLTLPFLVARLHNKKRNCGQKSTNGQPSVCGEQAETGRRLEDNLHADSGEAMFEWQPHRAGGGGGSWRKRV